MEFEVGTHEKVDELSVSGCSCSTCVDVGSNVVDFLAVLFDHNGTSCGSGVSSKNDSISILAADDGGACFFMGDG